MCGIVGMRRFDGRGPDVERAARRWPRRCGTAARTARASWSAAGVGLGHRRLSIIDLEHSQQPMSSADGRLHVSFNGEILNYRRLRADLDYPYRTSGDTEVLLAAHAPARPGGRGRAGRASSPTRPTTRTATTSGCTATGWASCRCTTTPTARSSSSPARPRRSCAACGRTPDLDLDSVADYLARRSVPAPWTLLQGIRKVEPGTSLRVHDRGVGEARRYWSVPVPPRPSRIDDEQGGRRGGVRAHHCGGPLPGGRRPGRRLPERWPRQQPDRVAHGARRAEAVRSRPSPPASGTRGTTSCRGRGKVGAPPSAPITTRSACARRTSCGCGSP